MTDRPGDHADKATDATADGAFGGVTNHRAGYGDDRLARLIDYLRRQPRATLASGEGALLLAEIDRLRDELHTQDGWVQWANGEMNALRRANKDSMDHYTDARAKIDRLTRILAALRDASMAVLADARKQFGYDQYAVGCQCMDALRAAVAQAEQEVGHA